jgi:putative acyl-CoA dehydrogenase
MTQSASSVRPQPHLTPEVFNQSAPRVEVNEY